MNNLLRSFRRHQPDVNALSAQLDGVLDPRESARLDAHVASCDACRAQLDGLRTTRATLRSMPDATPARSFRLRVADTMPVAVPRSPMLRWAPAAGAFAGVVVAVVVGASLYSGGSSNSSQETAKTQRDTGQLASAPRPTSAEGVADDASAGTSANDAGATAPDASEAPPSTGELASPEIAAAIPESTSEAGADLTTTTQSYDAATNSFSSNAARAVATAAVQIQAAAAAAPEDDGNNSAAVYVMVIIGVAAALVAAAIAIRWWRGRGEKAS